MAVAKKSIATETFTPETVAKTFETAAVPLKAVQENVRALAEKTLEQARTQYATIKKAAEDATGTVESTFGAFNSGLIALNTQALEALRANANATFDHFAKLQGVKSLAEAVELNAAHARAQMETITAQAKQLQTLAQKAANDTVAPVKAAISAKA